jgi:hypothetical protein
MQSGERPSKRIWVRASLTDQDDEAAGAHSDQVQDVRPPRASRRKQAAGPSRRVQALNGCNTVAVNPVSLREVAPLRLSAKSGSVARGRGTRLCFTGAAIRRENTVHKTRDPNGIRTQFSDFAKLRQSRHNTAANCALTAIQANEHHAGFTQNYAVPVSEFVRNANR